MPDPLALSRHMYRHQLNWFDGHTCDDVMPDRRTFLMVTRAGTGRARRTSIRTGLVQERERVMPREHETPPSGLVRRRG